MSVNSKILFLFIFSFSICHSQNNDSYKVYDDTEVAEIRITMNPADLQFMYDHPESDSMHLASVLFKNDLINETADSVGIRIRGNTSRASLKKSFKLSFDTFIPGRKFYSLEKLNLNGEHNDPSIARSKICWDFFNEFGIVSSQSAHTALFINNEYFGLYISVEHVDENFISKNFDDDKGNLWKCLYGADLTYINSDPNSYKFGSNPRVYDLITNENIDDYSKLAEFISFLNNSDPSSFRDNFQGHIDILSVVQYFAANVLLGSWDDYWSLSNNFYLYYNPSEEKFYIIPYDYDNTLGVSWANTDWANVSPYTFAKVVNGPRPLIERLLEIPDFKNLYSHVFDFYINHQFNTSLAGNRINDLKNKLYPWAVDDNYRTLDYGFSLDDFNNSFFQNNYSKFHVKSSIEDFISQRITSLQNQIEYVESDPIIYKLDVQPKSIEQNDSILVICSVFSNKDLYKVSIELENDINGSITVSEMIFSPDVSSMLISETDRWRGVLPPLGKGFSGTLKIIAQDKSGGNTVFPVEGYILNTAGEVTREVLISEIMSSNVNTITDNFGEYDDWFEIYNPNDYSIDLGGKYLTDKIDNLTKWKFPDNSRIRPMSYAIIWCDEDQEQSGPHVNFKLSSGGEFLAIVENDGVTIVDSVTFPSLNTDQSYARTNNTGDWYTTSTPSPGESNMLTHISNIPTKYRNSIIAYPNPFNPSTTIEYELKNAMNVEFKIFNILGKEIWNTQKEFQEKGKHSFKWNSKSNDNSRLSSGIYFMQIDGETFQKTIKLILLQ